MPKRAGRWYSDDAKAVPLYREYNPNEPSCNHNYTADRAEHDALVGIEVGISHVWRVGIVRQTFNNRHRR